MLPLLTVSMLSALIHFPPVPLFVSVMVPPLMVMSLSAFSPALPLASVVVVPSTVSVSTVPLPVVWMLMVPSLTMRSPAALTPFVATPGVVIFSVPPSM